MVIAGFIVQLLTHFNLTTNANDIAQVLSAIFIVVGVLKQWIAHKNLARSANII